MKPSGGVAGAGPHRQFSWQITLALESRLVVEQIHGQEDGDTARRN